ncbi:MAG TPA: hypothetical protein DCG34_03560 [Clostridiales bacterium]|jgi:uncharacterized protein YaiI (UPF0178 family)|nr:hypothetical protein [Clostridiales bacterium]
MKLIVDGDGCPQNARKICEEYATYYNIDMVVVSSHDHNMQGDFETIIVDKGKDSADFKVIELACEDDIVVTQDYGLASLLLAKTFAIINPIGFEYTDSNIDKLLMSRYLGQKIRRSGGRTKGPKKRTASDDVQFEEILVSIIERKIKN